MLGQTFELVYVPVVIEQYALAAGQPGSAGALTADTGTNKEGLDQRLMGLFSVLQKKGRAAVHLQHQGSREPPAIVLCDA